MAFSRSENKEVLTRFAAHNLQAIFSGHSHDVTPLISLRENAIAKEPALR